MKGLSAVRRGVKGEKGTAGPVKTLAYCQECHMKCPILATVEDGRVTGIAGACCEKGKYIPEKIYHPDRLITAWQRTGKRGAGKWRPISVEEALTESASRIAEIIDKHGPESIAAYTASFHRENSAIAPYLLAQYLNTPHVLSANHLCTLPNNIAQNATFGGCLTGDEGPDLVNSSLIVLWGASLWHARPRLYNEVAKAKRKGAQVIVVDPRPTKEAGEADLWLRIRPGTDGALALGLAHIIIKESLYDKAFIHDWTVGFERFAEHVRDWTPDRVATITWITEAQIIKAGRLIGTVKPASVHTRMGTGAAQANVTQTSRAIAILVALINSIDIKGGNLIGHDYGGFISGPEARGLLRASADIETKRFGAHEYPLMMGPKPPTDVKPGDEAYHLTANGYYHAHNYYGYQAIFDGKLKAVAAFASNFVINDVDSRRIVEALKALDFFVAIDLFSTPTTQFADIVIPAAHWIETDYVLNNRSIPSEPAVFVSRKIVEPPAGLMSDFDVAVEIVKKTGKSIPWNNADEFNNWRLKPLCITLRALKERSGQKISFSPKYCTYLQNGFRTISGKVEIYSSVFEKLGYEPLPVYKEPHESPFSTPQLAVEYPLILTDYRLRFYNNGELRNVSSLRKLAPDPELQIHPETAQSLGIEDRDWVYLETTPTKNPAGHKIKIRAEYTPAIDPRVVAAAALWWYPERPDMETGVFNVTINAILSQNPPYDPVAGIPQVRAVLCKVSKAPGAG